MPLHEKTFEINITHEILNLANSWSWFLTDIPLWRYWRPRYRLPFFDFTPAIATGLHINLEGKDDPTGNKGGGYDIQIEAENGNLLFIQYKNGDLHSTSPSTSSIFSKAPHDHLAFGINNNNKKDQHLLLQNLANGIGATNGNAVVYAFPLFANLAEFKASAGKLVRNTKFVSVADIDLEAAKNQVTIVKGQDHKFRICRRNSNRCELNFFYFQFTQPDYSPELISDILASRFGPILQSFLQRQQKSIQGNLEPARLNLGLRQAYIQFLRYLHHYFEVSPDDSDFWEIDWSFDDNYFTEGEFERMENKRQDRLILNRILDKLAPYTKFINELKFSETKYRDVPYFQPEILIPVRNSFRTTIDYKYSIEDIQNISYLIV